MQDITEFNKKLKANNHFIYAAGLANPDSSILIDNRENRNIVKNESILERDEFYIGLWILEAKDQADNVLKNKQLQIDALKTVAQMQNQKQNDKANRNMDALKTIAQMQHDKEVTKKEHALDILIHEDTLQHQRNQKPKGE